MSIVYIFYTQLNIPLIFFIFLPINPEINQLLYGYSPKPISALVISAIIRYNFSILTPEIRAFLPKSGLKNNKESRTGNPMFQTIGILGLGLIGGSLAKALKKYHPTATIFGYNRNPAAQQEALAKGAIDVSVQDLAQLSACDLIVLCCPVAVNIKLFGQIQPYLKPKVVVTDVGSTKGDIDAFFSNLDFNGYFVGGHPMAGSEKSGFSATRAELFENAYYVLTPSSQVPTDVIKDLKSLVRLVGAIPVLLNSTQHDYIIAGISHIPHILAACLVSMIQDIDTKHHDMHNLAAGGFRDFTRIAASSPLMWQQISLANQDQITKILDTFIDYLHCVKSDIIQSDEQALYQLFAKSKAYRQTFDQKAQGSLSTAYILVLDIEDEPGVIARIATFLGDNEISIKNIGINNNREDYQGVLEIVFYDYDSFQASRKLLSAAGYRIVNSD